MPKVLGKGKFLQLVRDGNWEYVRRANARGVVAIVAVTEDRRLILTDQFRPAVGHHVIDLPAGLSGDVAGQENEDLAISAMRELIEETGYVAKSLEHLADCPTSPGLTSEVVSLFLASHLRRKSAGGGVEGEQIDVQLPSLRGIDRWLAKQVAAGKLVDPKVYASLYFVKQRSNRAKSASRRK